MQSVLNQQIQELREEQEKASQNQQMMEEKRKIFMVKGSHWKISIPWKLCLLLIYHGHHRHS